MVIQKMSELGLSDASPSTADDGESEASSVILNPISENLYANTVNEAEEDNANRDKENNSIPVGEELVKLVG